MLIAEVLAKWNAHRLRMMELGLIAAPTYLNQEEITRILDRHLGTIELDELRKGHVEIYIGVRKPTCAPVTIAGEIAVLRQFLNWCLDEQLLVTKPRLPTVQVPLTDDVLPPDVAFIWVLTRIHRRAGEALEFMMLTGLSPHELERVQVQDATPYHRLGIGMRDDFPVKTPSRKRWVPLNATAELIWFAAAAGRNPTAHPFPSRDALEKAIQRLRTDDDAPIGVDQITPKMMRKWFSSKLSSEGEGRAAVPEHVLQRLLGHAPGSKVTRRHYVRSQDEQLVDAVNWVST